MYKKLNNKEWEEAVQGAYEKNKGKYSVQGFRKGHTPRIHALNVYKRGSDELNPSLNNITYISMANVTINKEYCIYLVAHEYITNHGYHRFPELSEQSDWRVQLKVRPTIRKINNSNGTTKAYNFQKNLIDFTYVDYLLIDEYKI